jgi:DNA-binding XRE family transcriptional regulator
MSAPEFTVNGEAFVVVPLREYEALRRLADTAEDAADEADALRIYEEHLSAKARNEALSMPAAQWKRIDEGASPLRVAREYRALTQIEPARRSGVKPSHISAIENGRRAGTTQTLMALAKALGAPLGVLAGE